MITTVKLVVVGGDDDPKTQASERGELALQMEKKKTVAVKDYQLTSTVTFSNTLLINNYPADLNKGSHQGDQEFSNEIRPEKLSLFNIFHPPHSIRRVFLFTQVRSAHGDALDTRAYSGRVLILNYFCH